MRDLRVLILDEDRCVVGVCSGNGMNQGEQRRDASFLGRQSGACWWTVLDANKVVFRLGEPLPLEHCGTLMRLERLLPPEDAELVQDDSVKEGLVRTPTASELEEELVKLSLTAGALRALLDASQKYLDNPRAWRDELQNAIDYAKRLLASHE